MLSLNNSIDIICNSLSLLQNGNLVDILTLIGQGGVDLPTLITSLLNDTTFMNAISQSNSGCTQAEADALFYSQTFLNTQLNSKLNASVINNYMLSTDINNLFSNYYTSTIADGRYYLKSDVYTKTEADNLLDLKQDIITSNLYGFNLLSTPQGAISNELKSASRKNVIFFKSSKNSTF